MLFRSFRRLLPALLLMVALTSLLFCLFVSPAENTFDPSKRTGITSLIGVSNVYLLRQGTNYFDFGTQFNPFLHTWSLGVEEQFYMVWPILVILCGVGAQKSRKHSVAALLALSIALSIASFAFYAKLSEQSGAAAAFYLMPARFWELAAGAIVFLLQSLQQQRLQTASQFIQPASRIHFLLAAGLCALLLSGFFLSPDTAGHFKPEIGRAHV